MLTLRMDGLKKAERGVTTLEQVVKETTVAGFNNTLTCIANNGGTGTRTVVDHLLAAMLLRCR